MLDLFELEEMDGLTPERVEEWVRSSGYVECGSFSNCRRYTRERGDQPESVGLAGHQIFVGNAQNLQSSLLLLAEREGVTLQELLRRINPRWRKKSPTGDERAWHLANHGGLWLRRHAAQTPQGVAYSAPSVVWLDGTEPTEAELERDTQTRAEHWPIDSQGYRVRWMLQKAGG